MSNPPASDSEIREVLLETYAVNRSSHLRTSWTTVCLKTSRTESGDGTTFGMSLDLLEVRGNAFGPLPCGQRPMREVTARSGPCWRRTYRSPHHRARRSRAAGWP